MGNRVLSMAWLALACIGLAGAAYLFRFEPMPTVEGNRNHLVWDRWNHEACMLKSAKLIVCPNTNIIP
jgi:hypothetical protein